ncbi:MAG: bifunctional hydroxymethylpyrimidine kinase/phosphomethylpyrimidine kinase [Anaerolineae bacterium]|nr:bifunctional hydroxymethylpyrimidine kinase/phosphomethylpyrimidine kinase [Anaerolineae bacterium]
MSTTTPRRVLSIGGSDSGGSAGIQADIKTLEARGVFGSTAITAVTAQDTLKVHRVHFVPDEYIRAQIEVVLNDIGTDAVKTGFLAKESVVTLVAEEVQRYQLPHIVVDPVLVDGSGKPFVSAGTITAYRDRLLPLATLITPNADEAALLTGSPMRTHEDLYEAAKLLHGLGSQAVVVKGGHLPDNDIILNVFYNGAQFINLTAPRLPADNPHGVGCTFASAAAAELAKGRSLTEAVTLAHRYLQEALAGSQSWTLGKGRLSVNHAVGRPPLFEA